MPNELAALQDWVGGKIETVTVASDCVVICNEEARIKGLAYNCKFCGMEFYGPLMLASRKGDEFCSLKVSKIPFLLKSLRGGVDK